MMAGGSRRLPPRKVRSGGELEHVFIEQNVAPAQSNIRATRGGTAVRQPPHPAAELLRTTWPRGGMSAAFERKQMPFFS